MNKVILIGGLTTDPEIKATNTGMKIANFSLGVSEGKDKEGLSVSSFHNCSAFDKTAEVIERYVKKGHKLMVVGKIKNETWIKTDGTKGFKTVILVNEVEMLTSKAEAERSQSYSAPAPLPDPAQVMKDLEAQGAPAINMPAANANMPF
jgi:single-strand DNA-binding protein